MPERSSNYACSSCTVLASQLQLGLYRLSFYSLRSKYFIIGTRTILELIISIYKLKSENMQKMYTLNQAITYFQTVSMSINK